MLLLHYCLPPKSLQLPSEGTCRDRLRAYIRNDFGCLNSIFSLSSAKKSCSIGDLSRKKLGWAATFLSWKVWAVLRPHSTGSREWMTSFLLDLGFRKTRMKERKKKSRLSSRDLLHSWGSKFVDGKWCWFSSYYTLREWGHMILLNFDQQLFRSCDNLLFYSYKI